MRISVLALAVLAALPSLAQLKASGDLHILTSEPVFEHRWDRTFVTTDGHGNIRGDRGKVGSSAANAAVGQLADSLGEIAEVARSSVTNAMDDVYSKTNQMAKSCIGVVFHLAPASDDEELKGYVVKTASDGTTDTQYVWYSRQLSLPLKRYVTYESTTGERDTVPCVWQTPFTNTVTVTHGGKTWTGCHVCTVQRSSFAVGVPCVDKRPNEVFGDSTGFNFGSMPVYVNGRPALTRVITNKLDRTKWIRVDNGFVKERSW